MITILGEGTHDGEVRHVDGREWEWSGGCWGAEDQKQAPAILCACGGTTFSISYGNYECFAHCACGRKFLIYDG